MTKNYTPLAVLVPNKGINEQDLATSDLGGVRELTYIKNKKEYSHFLRMCRDGKVATAVITAKALGVNKDTITSWYRTPAARKALLEASHKYVANIETSRDWKAHQWLLQQATQSEEKKESTGVTNQILIVNKDGQFRVGSQSVEAT